MLLMMKDSLGLPTGQGCGVFRLLPALFHDYRSSGVEEETLPSMSGLDWACRPSKAHPAPVNGIKVTAFKVSVNE